MADFEFLYDAARSFNRYVKPEPAREDGRHGSGGTGSRPGDDFNRKATWEEVLRPHGWEAVRVSGSTRYWRRPGKEGHAWSATTGHCSTDLRGDLLYVFSTSAAPFELEQSYSKFEAFALLNHNGDFHAAAVALHQAGYGDQSQPLHVAILGISSSGTNGSGPTPGQKSERLKPQGLCHNDLLDTKFPDLTWLVDGLVPQGGLTILGGKKKLGKSWMCLQLAQAVAMATETLTRKARGGKVAYICLEDGGRRLQSRLRLQKSPRDLPITWYTDFPKLDAGGLADLKELAQTRPALIVIDTLAAAKTGKVEENAAGDMGDLGNALRTIAQQQSVGLIVTHHHGKVVGGDPGDDLRGSSALAAAADVNLGLYRIEDGTFRLRGEGRDIEPFDYAVKFDSNGTWFWEMLGDARTLAKDEADQRVLLALSALKEADADALAEAVGVKRQTVSERLGKLLAEKKILAREDKDTPRPKGGRPTILYRLPPADQPPKDQVII